MSPKKRIVTYDISVLQRAFTVPHCLGKHYGDTTFLARALRHYFRFRCHHAGLSLYSAQRRRALVQYSAERFLRRVEIPHKDTYTQRHVEQALDAVYALIDRYVSCPGSELPNQTTYEQCRELDIGIPRDMFKHYLSEVTVWRILGRVRWLIHFDLEQDRHVNYPEVE
jgi:hypothetical protein